MATLLHLLVMIARMGALVPTGRAFLPGVGLLQLSSRSLAWVANYFCGVSPMRSTGGGCGHGRQGLANKPTTWAHCPLLAHQRTPAVVTLGICSWPPFSVLLSPSEPCWGNSGRCAITELNLPPMHSCSLHSEPHSDRMTDHILC